MTLQNSYKNSAATSTPLTLDTACNAASYFVGQWTPELKRNQSRDLLSLILSKMWFLCHGNLFHGRIRASDAALADSLDLSREWTNTLKGRLVEAKWITTEAPRLPNGKQEVTIIRTGKRLKRLLVMLLKSTQRRKFRVNTSSQEIPSKEQIEKNLQFLRGLQAQIGAQMDLNKKTRW